MASFNKDKLPIHLCSFTDVPEARIYLDGKPYYFEFSERFGPFRLHQRTRELTKIQKFPDNFWTPFEEWLEDYLKQKRRKHETTMEKSLGQGFEEW